MTNDGEWTRARCVEDEGEALDTYESESEHRNWDAAARGAQQALFQDLDFFRFQHVM